MKTIDDKTYSNTIEIKRSKFITIMQKISNKQELNEFLKVHHDLDATHHCYAYKFGIEQINGGYQDDGEPSGSAGMPIFKVIENNDLTNIIILVIRHYGGIKLGQGPLTRAYSKSASECLKLATIQELHKVYLTTIIFSITDIKKVDLFLLKNNYKVIEKTFTNNVEYVIQSEQNPATNNLFQVKKQQYIYQ